MSKAFKSFYLRKQAGQSVTHEENPPKERFLVAFEMSLLTKEKLTHHGKKIR